MSILKRKNLLVGVTTCALFLSTGCFQNLANSNFSPTNNFNAKQKKRSKTIFRYHNDGLKINNFTPDCFDEVFWLHLFQS